MQPDDEAIIAACARRFWRGLSPGLTRDDLMQEGRIALWVAQQLGRVPEEADHRRRYVIARVTGAMRDANRRAWRQQPMGVDELDDARHHAETTGAGPDAILQMREFIGHIAARSPGLRRCLEALADGMAVGEVAASLGVSPSRISQLRREARRTAAAFV